MDAISIIDYSDQYKKDFKQLNYEWIKRDFIVEQSDEIVLSNPVEFIINKGGYIFFAKLQDNIIGTCALIRIDDKTYEIAKMVVKGEFQSRGIGKIIMNSVLQKAISLNLDRLILYSHTDLTKAIRMYKKYGFRKIPKEDFHNKRANIKMELKLENSYHTNY